MVSTLKYLFTIKIFFFSVSLDLNIIFFVWLLLDQKLLVLFVHLYAFRNVGLVFLKMTFIDSKEKKYNTEMIDNVF